MREEGGVRALYRGLVTTAMGVAPYVGINFAAYEFLRGVVTPPGKSGIARKLSCGAMAGEFGLVFGFCRGVGLGCWAVGGPLCVVVWGLNWN